MSEKPVMDLPEPLSDQPHNLAALQREGDVVHRFDGALVGLEIGPQATDIQKITHLRSLGLS